tara:strand:- start:23 stop:901 length:879 start_codon:yes stop_codon:yes gene_type:complete
MKANIIITNSKMSLIKGKNIDVSKISFSQPRVLDNGAKLVYLNYGGGRLSVQTPWMSMPWKMGVYTEGDYPKYSVDLTFKGMDENPDLQGFHDKLQELEEKIIDGGFENSVSWFKKKPSSRDVVDALFSRIVKVSTDRDTGEPDGKWPPTMKLKVPRRDGVYETKVSDKSGKVYDINNKESGDNMEDLLVKNTKMRAIIQCVGLWVASGSYMCQWKLTKAEVEVPDTGGQHEFLADSDGEDGEEAPDNFIEDSNEEGSGDEEEEVVEEKAPSPSPEPAPKKKVVRRKVAKKA